MKKIFLILSLAIFSLTIFAQDEISFGVASQFQVKDTEDSWGEWEETTSPVLIYIDLGFGFVAVQNSYEDRFIITEMELTKENDERLVFTLKCTDKEAKPCTMFATFFKAGNFALVIQYSDISYAYLIADDMSAIGYPYKYFENRRESDEPSTNKFEGKSL